MPKMLCLENGRDQGPNQSEVLWGENDLDQPWISRWAAPAEGWLPTSPSCHGQHQHRLHMGSLWSHLIYFCLLIQHYQVTVTFPPILFYSGLDMKFKGIFHPIIISPIRVPELFKVTQRSEGMCVLVLQLNLISVSFIGNTYFNKQKVFLIVLVVTLYIRCPLLCTYNNKKKS